MKTTVDIDSALLAKAAKLSGEKEKSSLVRMGLEALIQLTASRRLAALGGTMPDLEIPPRKRLARNGK